jgi:hypothetical protein
MTLFDAPRKFIYLCINMSNMVFGTCWRCSSSLHRMYILLCFLLLLVTGFYPVWCGHCGFLEILPAEIGEGHLRHAPQWCTERGLRTGLKMAHVLCRHMVPGVGSPGFYAVCKPNAPPRGTDAKTGWPALGSVDDVLFLLLAVEWMLELLLLPYEKTIATKT